jgi:hypothetical protein
MRIMQSATGEYGIPVEEETPIMDVFPIFLWREEEDLENKKNLICT